MTARDPEKLFSDISRFIDESNALLVQDKVLQMGGFDDMVRSLCEEVLALTPEQREKYAERMQQLLAGLQQLGDAMVEKRDAVGQDINALSNHERAHVAYRTADASDKKTKKE